MRKQVDSQLLSATSSIELAGVGLAAAGPGMPQTAGEAADQAPERARAVLGSLLFIAAVESAFQLHQQCGPPATPAGIGARVPRIVKGSPVPILHSCVSRALRCMPYTPPLHG